MYRCCKCERLFTVPRIRKECTEIYRGVPVEEEYLVCPFCGADHYERFDSYIFPNKNREIVDI